MRLKLTTLALLLPIMAAAQNFSNLDFEQAKQRASKEKKIILVDVTSQRMMGPEKLNSEKQLAANAEVAEFCSKNLISVRMDMGSEAGKSFAPLLQMNMYPAYAFMMPNGDLLEIIHPSRVYNNPGLFLEKANSALSKANNKWSNSRSIVFQDISFEEALKLSKSSGKPIFIDAYTDNCQPCIRMVKDVFSVDRVADYYNENFICLSMNLGTVHTNLAEKYSTNAYPTYLFISADEKLIYSASGYTEADEFISYGKSAQNKSSIQFEKGTWKDIVSKAKRENKPIFLDCYTTWCGPCKQMNNTVFTLPEVAEYFNTNFINAKFDMEKGEGLKLKEIFGINAFPTYVYIDVNEVVLNKIVGSMPAEEFLTKSQEGLSENGLLAMQKRYSSGERDDSFILQYLRTLEMANMIKDARKVADGLFKSTDLNNFKNKEYFKHFLSYMEDSDSDLFKYVYKSRSDFYNIYPQDVVDRKLRSIWENGANRYVQGSGENATIDKEGFKKYIKRMKDEGVEDYQSIEEKANIFNAIQTRNWKSLLSMIDTKIKKTGLANMSETEMLAWGMQIDRLCTDKKIRSHAAGWYEKFIPLFEAKQARKKAEAEKNGYILAMSMVDYHKELIRIYKSLSNN